MISRCLKKITHDYTKFFITNKRKKNDIWRIWFLSKKNFSSSISDLSLYNASFVNSVDENNIKQLLDFTTGPSELIKHTNNG